jgi:Flp pilus assembly pilin Flp
MRAALRRDAGASVVEYGLLLVAVAGIVVGMAVVLYRSI